MDFLTCYGSLRHRAEQRLDAMAQVLIHASVCGMRAEPASQLLDLVAWAGPGLSSVVISVDDAVVRFACVDEEGETASLQEVPLHDLDTICAETEAAVDYLLSL